jgi:hypothetical protein
MAHFNAAKNDETSDPLNIDSSSKRLPQEKGCTSLRDCSVTLKLLGHQLNERGIIAPLFLLLLWILPYPIHVQGY